MKHTVYLLVAFALAAVGTAVAEAPAVTVYNQDFGVVRETITLELERGVCEAKYAGMTAHVEPDSVVLRDPKGKRKYRILEQNYWNEPISEGLLLAEYEGEEIEFAVRGKNDREEIVPGRIIRSAYVPHQAGLQRYGEQYRGMQSARAYGGGGQSGQPIVEVGGKVRFGLPGTPLFPELGDAAIMKPTMHWLLETDAGGTVKAELSYLTGGMSWEADYNLIAPEKGDDLDLTGWVTIDNQSGKTFDDAIVKLMAGDVSKVREAEEVSRGGYGGGGFMGAPQPTVTERPFDEYHLYTIERPTTLRDRETKQIEFVHASEVGSNVFYLYKGAVIDHDRYRGQSGAIQDRQYGTKCNPKIWVMREFENTKKNGLGIPLPKGRLRFYRRDGANLEFTGENIIDHTPRDETVRVYTGNAFDIVGERRQTNFNYEPNRPGPGGRTHRIDETFEIVLRNHKDKAVEVRVVEELYRYLTWEIVESSNVHKKLDSRTIEFRVQVKPNEEAKVTYTVRYSW